MKDSTIEQLSEFITAIILVFLLGFLYKWIWNETMPYLFGLPTITYWKIVGLTLLSKALFGNLVRLKQK